MWACVQHVSAYAFNIISCHLTDYTYLIVDGSPSANLGLCYHAGIEEDASMSRTDTHLAGPNNKCELNMTLWEQMKNLAEGRPDKWSESFFSDLRYLR